MWIYTKVPCLFCRSLRKTQIWAKASFVSDAVLTSNEEDSSCSRECTIHVFSETWQMDKRWCLD